MVTRGERAQAADVEHAAAVLAEACARMARQHYRRAADIGTGAAHIAEWGPGSIAGQLEREAIDQADIGDIYAWYALYLGGAGICTCRFPRYCPSGPAGPGGYWLEPRAMPGYISGPEWWEEAAGALEPDRPPIETWADVVAFMNERCPVCEQLLNNSPDCEQRCVTLLEDPAPG